MHARTRVRARTHSQYSLKDEHVSAAPFLCTPYSLFDPRRSFATEAKADLFLSLLIHIESQDLSSSSNLPHQFSEPIQLTQESPFQILTSCHPDLGRQPLVEREF